MTIKAVLNHPSARERITSVLFLLAVFLLLFFRNSRMFIYPEPWAEDFRIFLCDEYNVGFPKTAFLVYSGYVHLIPRIIAWAAMKTDFSGAMLVMNWSVLLIKILIFFLIYRTKEITSGVIKFSLIAYLVLLPFCDEVYNNVTNLQWWLIPLMALLIIRRESGICVLLLDSVLLALAGLTGLNSILFAAPCFFLLFMLKTRECLVKSTIVIICAFVQFNYLSHTPRIGGAVQFWSVSDTVSMFVNRVIYHTLFDFHSESSLNFLVFFLYMAALAFNLYWYRKKAEVWFVFFFSAICMAATFYTLMGQRFDVKLMISGYLPDYFERSGFYSERYFVIPRIGSFLLLVSSLNILVRSVVRPESCRKVMCYVAFILCLVMLSAYHINFPCGYRYHEDVAQFEKAKPGETVTFHFPPAHFGFETDVKKLK